MKIARATGLACANRQNCHNRRPALPVILVNYIPVPIPVLCLEWNIPVPEHSVYRSGLFIIVQVKYILLVIGKYFDT